jgi:hypothetical protein
MNYYAFSVAIFTVNLSLAMQKDIYNSIDGTKWELSKYLNETYFNKSKYYPSEQTSFQNLTFPGKNYTVPLETLLPYQDMSYNIFEVGSNGALNNLSNLTIKEFSSESNIFYEKYQMQNSCPSLQNNYFNLILNKSEIKNEKFFLHVNKNKINLETLSNTQVSVNTPVQVECNSTYSGLSLDSALEKITENSFYENVVNFFSINFVTYKNSEGVFVEKFLNGKKANKTEITNFITNKSYTDFSKIKIAKIFPSLINQRHYLFFLDESYSKVYLLRIKSDEQILKEFNSQISGLSLDVLFTFENEQIEKFDFKNLLSASLIQEQSSVYFVTQSALYIVYYMNKVTNIISIDSFQDPDTAETIKFDVIGAAFDTYGCSIALRNYGLIGFYTKEEKLSLILKHPKIHRIDSFFFQTKNIGVYLNNLKNVEQTYKSKEFLIELNKVNIIFKGNFTVNKVFFSDNEKTKADYYSDSVLDISSSRSFILEKQLNKVYLIARNLPYKINNIDTYFTLPQELKNKAYSYFNLVSIYEDKNKAGKLFLQGILLLQTNDLDEYKFFRFIMNESRINCEIKQPGTYWFKHNFYSFENNQLTFYSLDKKISLYNPVDENEDYTFVVILIIIAAIAAGIGVYFGVKKCRQSRIFDNYYNINS